VLKFRNVHYRGNGGLSDVYFNAIVKLLGLENPVWCNILGTISCISAVLANFVFENHQLVTMVTRVGLRQILTMPLNCRTAKTPSLVQTSCCCL